MSKTDTTKRKPKHPDFYTQADYFMAGFPGMIAVKDYAVVRKQLAEIFTSMFVLGMQEARERIADDNGYLSVGFDQP